MLSYHRARIPFHYPRPLEASSKLLSTRYLSSKKPNLAPIEDIYEKKTQREHVLLRPGMYIGQTSPANHYTWLYNSSIKKMEKSAVYYSAGLLKIFDEILVNAADNRIRNAVDSRMTYIDVRAVVDKNELLVSVKNNGKSIPVIKSQKENIYIPELIFGHLLTGSNFDDKEAKFTGGMHGYGAKLTNIFSKLFKVEIYDKKRGLLYSQEWSNNMNVAHDPVVVACNEKDDYTKISFVPDLERFETAVAINEDKALNESRWAIVDDILKLMQRRTLDISACVCPVKVSFNGQPLKISQFHDYMTLFCSNPDQVEKMAHIKLNDQWEVGVIPTPTGTYECMAFVNSIWTSKGGSHVNVIVNQCHDYIEKLLKKQKIDKIPTVNSMKEHLMLFVNSLIVNPSYDSQSKDSLLTKSSKFGSPCTLPSSFLKIALEESSVLEALKAEIKEKEKAEFSKSLRKGGEVDVEDLHDAHFAGSSQSRDCTLIITEGLSAKALALAGIDSVERNYFGVLPIRGKLLNVTGASGSQYYKNKELLTICQCLGLEFGKDIVSQEDLSKLRYGKVMFMTDQDVDGLHIKGLLLNFFVSNWPGLVQNYGFLQQFSTPLIKVFVDKLGSEAKSSELFANLQRLGKLSYLQFFAKPDYDDWRNKVYTNLGPGLAAKFRVKYYKGLGTNTNAEAKEYFTNIDSLRQNFKWGERTASSLLVAFGSEHTPQRKKWILKFDPTRRVDISSRNIPIEDFVDKDLIQYSREANIRSIPSVIDGLKPAHRKILYTCFKKKFYEEVKVVQLAGAVMEESKYHHGDSALYQSIIKMAQDYVGSNNIPLLVPCGQFGTRHQAGDDSASPRYIFTKLSTITRKIFPEADDQILTHVEEDGDIVEPNHYLPIIPLVLVNGSRGIGLGWSTEIPQYHPVQIIDYLLKSLEGSPGKSNEMPKLIPWCYGFKGTILPIGKSSKLKSSYYVKGIAERKSKTRLEITELPYDTSTQAFKELILKGMKNKRLQFTKLSENHRVNSVHFTLSAKEAYLDELENPKKESSLKSLGLISTISMNNMMALDKDLVLTRYDSPYQIIDYFSDIRLNGYRARKDTIVEQLKVEESRARNRAKFISEIVVGRLKILKDNKSLPLGHLVRLLEEKGFDKHSSQSNSSSVSGSGFSYLLDMPVNSFTTEKLNGLQSKSAEKQQELSTLISTTPEMIWIKELQELKEAVLRYYEERESEDAK